MGKSKSVKVFLVIQLIGVLISLAGIARMGFNHGRGNSDDSSIWIVLSGTALTIIGGLLNRKINKEKT